MRLVVKLIVAISCAILLVFAINAFVRIRREVRLFEDDTRKDSRLLGRALAGAAQRIWATVGEAEALDLVEAADERESHVVLSWIPVRPGAPGARQLSPEQVERLVRGEDVVFNARLGRGGEERFLFTYVPVSLPDGRAAAIELRESLSAERDYVRRTIFQAVVATSSLVLLCSALAAGLGMLLVGRPVRRLVDHARRIGAGDLSPSSDPTGSDEIAELGREMNAMCERLLRARQSLEEETASRLATQEQLRHADRLTTVGKLAAGIAHEVGTPLNVITGYAQLIREEYPQGSAAHDNAIIVSEQAHRVAAIIRQLLDFARRRPLNKERHALADVARQAVSLMDAMAQKRNVALELKEADEAVLAKVDSSQILQVVINLVVNGLQSMPGGGRLSVGVCREAPPPEAMAAAGDRWACLYVEDTGVGMSEDVLSRIFEPFFTTKEVGEGTGLGLSVAYGIVKEHDGWIDVRSELGEGSKFSVYLPPVDDE